MKVVVSGKTYSACLDPLATAVPGEFGFPNPTVTRMGKGYRYTYQLGESHVADMLWHLELMGSTFAVGDDNDTRADGRAILKDAARLRAMVTQPSLKEYI